MKHKRSSSRIRAPFGPAIETLEGRTLLSATSLALLAARQRAHPTYELAHQAGLAPAATAGPIGFSASQIRHAYGVDSINFGGTAGTGTGQTIAIIDAYDDPNAASDLHNFDLAEGLSDPPSFTKLNETGGTTLPPTDSAAKPNTWELEESLDIEWAHAIAPGANIILYEANSTSFNDLVVNAVNTARNNPGVTEISMSFGGGESSGESAYDSYFTTPTGHQGITFLASTGDSGSPGGYPAYSPNVVAVGGTTLTLSSTGGYQSETAWSSSGGGVSTQEPEPGYQNSVQSTGSRIAPDVSMDANPSTGVAVYDTFDNGTSTPWIQVGGTSLSSPMWAGLIAIANQGRVQNGLTSLNGQTQTLPMLYQAQSADFHDITSGSNGGYSAAAGYDAVTGRGTPVANLLVQNLAGTPQTAASYVRTDTTTQGTWVGTYGADGYALFNGATSYPSYAQVTASGQQSWTWANSTADLRALQAGPGSPTRMASCLYSGNTFSLDVNLTDGRSHQVALYMLDWDSTSRVQTVQVTNGTTGSLLDTRSVSNFNGGQYLVWNLTGHVKITFTCTGGVNAVGSGLFFGGSSAATSAATFVRADTTTQGSWTGIYGSDGYSLFNGPASNPAYAQVTPGGQQAWTWTSSTSDVRALQTAPASLSRQASCYYSGGSFTLSLNLTDGLTHQVALYMVDFDQANRAQTVQVSDVTTGTMLDTRNVSSFQNGQWLVWNVKGNVKITINSTGGVNAVASGLFFGPAA